MITKPKQSERFVVRPMYDPHELVPREWIIRGKVLLQQEADRLFKALPARLAPLIVAEPDPTKQKAIIDREVRRMVRKFNATHRVLLEKIASTEH